MRTDKKSEFLKALKRDRVEEEHEDGNHARQEKVIFFIPAVGPTVTHFRLNVKYITFICSQLLRCGLGCLNVGKELPFD